MNGATNSGNCSGLTHFQASNSGCSVARLMSASEPVNRIANPSGTYRAPGRYEGSFFCERLIELTAQDLGIDSAEMRRRNLIGAGEMPYPLPRLEQVGPAGNTE